jgi:hypothetical protein
MQFVSFLFCAKVIPLFSGPPHTRHCVSSSDPDYYYRNSDSSNNSAVFKTLRWLTDHSNSKKRALHVDFVEY